MYLTECKQMIDIKYKYLYMKPFNCVKTKD